MKSFLNRQKKLSLILTIIVIFFVCLFKFILNKPFILGNDQWFQYNVFYKEWINLVLEFFNTKALPFYSWNTYLGTDFYSAMGYYCTGDIFLPILLLFRNHIEIGLVIESILCIYISGILMNEFLFKISIKNEKQRIFISLIYALAGEAVLYFGIYMFHRFYAFLPLLFIGLFNYLDNKKVITFIIATAILLLQNYYFMFPTLIFLLIFSISEELKRNKTLKEILKDFFILLGCLILGFMISAFITLPSMYYLIHNSRVGSSALDELLWNGNIYSGLYISLISYNPMVRGVSTIFAGSELASHDSWFSLFITIIPLCSCIDYVLKKENKIDLITLLILIIIAIFRPLSSIMHGLSQPSLRWLFLLQFYLLYLSSKNLEELDYKKSLRIYLVYLLGLFIQLILLFLNGYISNQGNYIHFYIILISICFGFLILILFNKNKTITYVLTLLEIIGFYTYGFYKETGGVYIGRNAIDKDVISYYQSEDEDIYRYHHSYLNNDPNMNMNLNKSIEYGMMSISTYLSTYDCNITEFNKLSNSAIGFEWMLEVDDPYATTMLGCKYYIVYDESELPEELDFEYAYNLDYLKVYRNLNYVGFGYSAKDIKYTKDFESTKDFVDYILVDDETIDISKYTNLTQTKLNIDIKYKNYFKASINLSEDNIVLIPIPNNEGWTIKVNGQEVEPISVNGGFIGLELQAGENNIEMNFTSPYFKQGVILSGIGALALIGVFIIQRKRV